MSGLIYTANDNLIRAMKLSTIDQFGATVYLDNAATVQCTLTDSSGVALAGEAWPIPLAYVPNSLGEFIGVLRNDIVYPASGSVVYAKIIVDNGDDQHGEWTGRLTVQDRQW